MKDAQDRVELFMRKAGQFVPDLPQLQFTESVSNLRVALIEEELGELECALQENNLINAADAIGDLLVVVLGTAVALGIKIEPVFKEIMDSNMTKFIDGHRREDGKWIKGSGYKPANLKPILWDQLHP